MVKEIHGCYWDIFSGGRRRGIAEKRMLYVSGNNTLLLSGFLDTSCYLPRSSMRGSPEVWWKITRLVESHLIRWLHKCHYKNLEWWHDLIGESKKVAFDQLSQFTEVSITLPTISLKGHLQWLHSEKPLREEYENMIHYHFYPENKVRSYSRYLVYCCWSACHVCYH